MTTSNQEMLAHLKNDFRALVAARTFKIINVGQVLVTATAEYKTHGRFRPNAMDNAENKILAGDLEPTHAKRSFQVPRVPREKHYNDSLSRQSRRFKNPNKRPNVMQVDHLTTAVGFQ